MLLETLVFCAFPASDSIYNLEPAFGSLKQQVNDLQESSWRDKKFRVCAFGDYEYLCKMYGLAGASGRHCCLRCNTTKLQMRQPPTSQSNIIEARTLETLQWDLQNFRNDGSKPDRTKTLNNVIEEPLFNIPLDQLKESEVAKQQTPKLKRADGPIVRKLEETLQLIKVHRQAYHGRSFVELTIKGYMAYFRQEFADETSPPKTHMLECPTVPFIRRWKVGLAFHGEQGVNQFMRGSTTFDGTSED
ncbi:hypothetical protein HOLleu_44243 [Holothuria leucospilota]|uniref:Uncharacterized protein n=1 Tax=Holothuria leucospilota TaxID=206669 RepID=A0A9Q1B9F1_HOLLE|nr:hypothetical protein HOLleu_44243 [Holothuria leucospilota]